MPIYQIDGKSITRLERTTFAEQNLRERRDLQSLLKDHIEVISEDTLIVAEEFGDWEESRRRIDLLGVDKDANLVVFELKRTEDGGHMELQALRYAAMISTLTFERLVSIYEDYLRENEIDQDATERLLEFLDWSEPREELFGKEVRIVLASGEFSKELTTSVMWLNDYGLDIRCVRMQPYASEGRILMDVQTVIPVPEASDYQVRIREKKREERESRKSARGGGYEFSIAGERHRARSNRQFMYLLVSGILNNGGEPRQIMESVPWRPDMLVRSESPPGDDEQALHFDDETYVLSKRWGPRTLEAADSLARTFPDLQIEITQVPRTGGARFDLLVAGERYPALTRPQVMLRLVSAILSEGGTPQKIREALPWRRRLLEEFEGTPSAELSHRYFCGEGEVLHFEDKTYVLSNHWKSLRAPEALAEAFPQLNIQVQPAGSEPSQSIS